MDHESPAATAWPEAQRAASAALIADIANRWSIAPGPDTVVPHSAIRASSHCPGPGAPLAEIRVIAAGNDAISTDEMELGDGGHGAGSALDVDRTTLALPATQYYAEDVHKDLIVLHFTAGTTARQRVSRPAGEASLSTPPTA